MAFFGGRVSPVDPGKHGCLYAVGAALVFAAVAVVFWIVVALLT